MDRDTVVCPHCDTLVPLADNVRRTGEQATFVCPACHTEPRLGGSAKDLPGRSEVEGPRRTA